MDQTAAVLIVDDYLLIRTAVRQVLAELGFTNVFQADNGKAAQDLMQRQRIDVVIGDWGMPVMSGIDLLEWMRRDLHYAAIPFMMLTAEANPASVRTALEAGVNAYMIKPFTVHSFASKFMAMVAPLLQGPAGAPPPSDIAPATPQVEAGEVIGLAPPLAERLRKCTVLIVDDIATNIDVLAGILKDEYAVKVAINGNKALEIANAFHVDLILLDIMMPVMDGFEVCRQLKAGPKTAHIPIIFLSARDGVDDVVAGLKLGAVDYVSKPADPTILKARLSAHLALAAAMAELKQQNALLAETAHLREDVERMTRHDLKSPIAVAMHGAQALLAGGLTEGQRNSARMIEQAAGNALDMINRTLDLYKMEKGEYRPQLERFDLSALLRKVAEQAGLAFGARGVRFLVSGPSGPVRCVGEPLLCYSMFNNALKNAAEAAPDGASVTVELAPGDGAAHVVIENRGEVAPAMRERFFDKYAPSDKVGGHGLGTYSIRLMAGVQGGDVAMDTGDGITRLTFTLPAA